MTSRTIKRRPYYFRGGLIISETNFEMTNKIISIIREKFIENLDEGLLLRPDIGSFKLSEEDRSFYGNKCNTEVHSSTPHDDRSYVNIPEKGNPIAYLTAVFLTTKLERKNGDRYENYYAAFDNNFTDKLFNYWGKEASILKVILNDASEFISAEAISDKDSVIINVGYRWYSYEGSGSHHPKLQNAFEVINNDEPFTYYKKADCKEITATFADLFIVSSKYFIKLSLGSDGVINRTEHVIQRDINKLNIIDNNKLEIYFHGHFDPEIIVIDDYKSALQLQRQLTELRQVRSDKGHNKR